MHARFLRLICITLTALPLQGCAPAEPQFPPNVLIIVLDALRADKVGAYGFTRDTTPHLDAFAEDPDSVLFARHYVQSTWTKPSTASLFTGLYPFQHGVVGGHKRALGNRDWTEVTTPILADSFTTLAERLTAAGFDTFGVVKSHHLLPEYGFAQGFAHYLPPSAARGDAKRVEKTLELARNARAPFFGYVHLTAVHYPWPEKKRDPAYMSEHALPYDESSRAAQGIDFRGPEIRHAIRRGEKTLEAEDVGFLNLVYEAGLRRTDRELLAPLIDGLVEADLYDSTLIVVTADHGEELYDHRGYAHGHTAWEEVGHVPLVVKFPKGRRPAALERRVENVSTSIDLAPALLDWVAAPDPGDLPGARIFRGEFGGPALIEGKADWGLVRDDLKLVNRADAWHLYDLANDPSETRDLASSRPAEVADLRDAAARIRNEASGPRAEAPVIGTELGDEAIQDLKALGYIE